MVHFGYDWSRLCQPASERMPTKRMDTDIRQFRVLLAEDDPVSREFLAEAVRGCGAEVTDCVDGNAALDLARAQAWDLLILDHHLPGRNGDSVLADLRAGPDAVSRTTPAIATSAARDAEMATLLAAGFAEVLPKPMPTEILRAALRRHGCPVEFPLDDEDALRACGSAAAVARLRRLFANEELPKVQDELDRVDYDPQSLRPILHRLIASCGFCGAVALAQASATLHRALTTGTGTIEIRAALENFRDTLAETRAALALRENTSSDHP